MGGYGAQSKKEKDVRRAAMATIEEFRVFLQRGAKVRVQISPARALEILRGDKDVIQLLGQDRINTIRKAAELLR